MPNFDVFDIPNFYMLSQTTGPQKVTTSTDSDSAPRSAALRQTALRHALNRRALRLPLAIVLIVLTTTTSMLHADNDNQTNSPSGNDNAPVSREEYNRVVEELKRVRSDVDRVLANQDSPSEPHAPHATSDNKTLDKDPANIDLNAKSDSGVFDDIPFGPDAPRYRGGVYDKPFLDGKAANIYLGGYFDIEYRNPENQKHDFRFHRLIPFIYGDIHERIRFATELEFEDGSEVEVEFAHLDFLFTDEINFRGGVILDPLGKFNLIHDSPINDLTDRPLINNYVIPTTLREIGVGFFGDLLPEESEWELKYEGYLTSGFKGFATDVVVNVGEPAGAVSTISSAKGLRDARPSKDTLGTKHYGDVNEGFAGVGRISVSPFLGSEIGLSAHGGTYDESSDNMLTISAVDAMFTVSEFQIGDIPVGPIEFQGEGAYASVERDSFTKANGVADDMWGYYVQMNYHFMPQTLVDNLPLVFLPESTFTAVLRWGEVDLDDNEMTRLTAGLNFRPIEAVVFKFDYQFNHGSGKAPKTAKDDAFLISLASYF
jgi:hypothetical protein